MLNTNTHVLRAEFTFEVEPLDQIFGQIEKEARFNWLEFDLDICGFFDGTVYFAIDRIILDNIASLNNGNAWIELETNLCMSGSMSDGQSITSYIADFIRTNNFTIFLIDNSGKHGTIRVAFKDFIIIS